MTQRLPAPPKCEVIILTALSVEYRAVIDHLQNVQEVVHEQGTIYQQGIFADKRRSWRVAVAEIGTGGPTAATSAERAINYFRPRIALFVGIAGGLKDVRPGDVVVGNKIYAYESGKVATDFELRPVAWQPSYRLEQRARAEARNDRWRARLGKVRPDLAPQVHIGALAAGEKVLASTRSRLYQHLKTNHGDALAVEMEGHGFLYAVHINHPVDGLVIRGISNLIDDKPTSEAAGWQDIAAQHAAAFAFQVLASLMPVKRWFFGILVLAACVLVASSIFAAVYLSTSTQQTSDPSSSVQHAQNSTATSVAAGYSTAVSTTTVRQSGHAPTEGAAQNATMIPPTKNATAIVPAPVATPTATTSPAKPATATAPSISITATPAPQKSLDVTLQEQCQGTNTIVCEVILTNASSSTGDFQWTGTTIGAGYLPSHGDIAPGKSSTAIQVTISTNQCPANYDFTDTNGYVLHGTTNSSCGSGGGGA